MDSKNRKIDVIGLEKIVEKAERILADEILLEKQNGGFVSMLQDVVSLKGIGSEANIESFYDKVEEIVGAAMTLDFSERVEFTSLEGLEGKNLFNLFYLTINTIFEQVESLMVSSKTVNSIISDISDTLIFVTSEAGKIKFVNDIAERDLGIKSIDLIGSSITQFVESPEEFLKWIRSKETINGQLVKLQSDQFNCKTELSIIKCINDLQLDEYVLKFKKHVKSNPIKENGNDAISIDANERFLEAIEIILAKLKTEGRTPNNEASMSIEVFGDRTIISKVKCGTRSFTKSHLRKFGLRYNLNFNWFFRTSNSLWNENTDADKKEVLKVRRELSYANKKFNKLKKEKEELTERLLESLQKRLDEK
ncbi:MAG: hypothetical protein HRT71_14105 [Flavobacteriales bacterium]|nr:hypothetical protein [Flavobacteriales bacterium]